MQAEEGTQIMVADGFRPALIRAVIGSVDQLPDARSSLSSLPTR